MNDIIIYQTTDKQTHVEVKVDEDTVWLTQVQMAELFEQTKQNISLHINNCFKEGELIKDSTVKESLTVRKEGNRTVKRRIEYYNLDVIISVGYRVKSLRGTQFRIWANAILKDHLIKGYSLNEKKLKEREQELQSLKSSIDVLERSIHLQVKTLDEAKSLVSLLADFSTGLQILDDYDHAALDGGGITKRTAVFIEYKEFYSIVQEMKKEFTSELFGKEKDESFRSSVAQIYQSFGDSDLYPSIEEKAALLLYFIVKNHTFIDGNKRIAAACFLYFLDKNHCLYNRNGTQRLSNEGLASLTLLIAESKLEEMEIIKKIVVSILNRSKK